MKINQFDILLANLSPTKSSEQNGVRPCVVVETNGFRNRGRISIVAPMTSNIQRVFPIDTVVEPSKKNGLTEKSKISPRQIRVIDNSRIIKKIGALEEKYYQDILDSLELLFDFNRDFS